MLRRLLATLIIASYVASQLAALPHVHASPPANHGTRPHAHGDWLARLVGRGVHGHDHNHHDGGHHHHDSTHFHSHVSPQPTPVPADPADQGHDEDCVYLPGVATSVNQNHAVDWFAEFVGCIAPFQGACDSLGALAHFRAAAHAPPAELAGDCALYLTLRTLRI